jgi:hypothetical protein
MGSDKWLTVERVNTKGRGMGGVVERLREEGYRM